MKGNKSIYSFYSYPKEVEFGIFQVRGSVSSFIVFLGDGDVMDELIMNVYVVQGSYGTGGWIWFTEFWL